MISSRYALEEAARNIAVKFPECVSEFNNVIAGLVLVAEPSKAESQLAAAQDLPGKDVPILAAAIGAGVSILVTGDRRNFGHLYRAGSLASVGTRLPEGDATCCPREDAHAGE